MKDSGYVPTAAELEELKNENSRLLREDITSASVVFRALPEILSIYATNRCNLACVMCPRSLSPGHDLIDRDVLETVCAELLPTARKMILAGDAGEPMLGHYDLLLEYAARYRVRIEMFTNGTLMTGEYYRRSRDHLDVLNVSLDAHRPEVYAHVRPGLPFERVHENLQAIKKERTAHPDDVVIALSMVIMTSNVHLLPDFVRFAKELDVDLVIGQKLFHYGMLPGEDPETSPGREGVGRIFDEALAIAREVGMNLSLGEFGYTSVFVNPLRPRTPEPLEGTGLCFYVAQNFGVFHTGDVFPCCFPTDYRFGNLYESGPREIWNSARARTLRRAQYSGRGTIFCSGCLHGAHFPQRRPAWIRDLARRIRLARQAKRSRRIASRRDEPGMSC